MKLKDICFINQSTIQSFFFWNLYLKFLDTYQNLILINIFSSMCEISFSE